jgi:hypothetical protein
MVAFMPYKANGRAIKHIDPTGDKGPTLTVYSLAATLKPLLKRIFSTGCNCWVEERWWPIHIRDACEGLKSIAFNDNVNNNNEEDGDIVNFENQQPTVIIHSNNTNAIATIGYTSSSSLSSIIIDDNKIQMMEVAHVQLTNKNWYEYTQPGCSRTLENVPRGAIIGMQHALSGKMKSKKEQIKWLGERYDKNDKNNNNKIVGSESHSNSDLDLEEESSSSSSSSSYWQYVLLTEPDSVLNLNHDLLPLIKQLGTLPPRPKRAIE